MRSSTGWPLSWGLPRRRGGKLNSSPWTSYDSERKLLVDGVDNVSFFSCVLIWWCLQNTATSRVLAVVGLEPKPEDTLGGARYENPVSNAST